MLSLHPRMVPGTALDKHLKCIPLTRFPRQFTVICRRSRPLPFKALSCLNGANHAKLSRLLQALPPHNMLKRGMRRSRVPMHLGALSPLILRRRLAARVGRAGAAADTENFGVCVWKFKKSYEQ